MALPSALQLRILAQLELSKVLSLPLSLANLADFTELRYAERYEKPFNPAMPGLEVISRNEYQWFCLYKEYYVANPSLLTT